MFSHIQPWLDRLFPRIAVTHRPVDGPVVVFFLVIFAVTSALGSFIPADGMYAVDWRISFGTPTLPGFYPPWTSLFTQWLTWPTLIGFTVAAVCTASYLKARDLRSVACAALCWPTLWTLLLGQIDGIVLLGVMTLPWLAPLALIKPQIAAFAFLARPERLAALVITLLASLVIWGWWPAGLLQVAQTFYIKNIALGWVGWPLMVLLLWPSRGDEDMLMLAGMCVTPYLMPYSMILVAPAVARLPFRAALAACLMSWLTLFADWFGPVAWWLGWAFVAWLWVHLALMRYPHTRPARWLQARGWLPTP